MKSWITLGSDPEFACFDKESVNYVALCGLLGGTKDEPEPLPVTGCFKQEDNVGAEFTIPPCDNLRDIYTYIYESIDCTNDYLKDINKNWYLKAVSSARFPENELCSKQALTFGCEPSFSIYKGQSERPSAAEVGNLRTFGFHLHFGFEDKLTDEELEDFIFLCDLFLGLPSVIYDKDQERRKIYGNLGDYRKTSYGCEYRVMGIGMFEHYDIIENGLATIKTVIEADKTKQLKDSFFSTVLEIDSEIKTINRLRVKSFYMSVLNSLK